MKIFKSHDTYIESNVPLTELHNATFIIFTLENETFQAKRNPAINKQLQACECNYCGNTKLGTACTSTSGLWEISSGAILCDDCIFEDAIGENINIFIIE